MQFSLKTLFIAVTAFAFVCGIAFAPPQLIGFVVLMLTLAFAPPVLISGAVYLRGKWQAFCIGGASMSCPVVLTIFGPFSFYGMFNNVFGSGNESEFIWAKIYMAFLWVLIVISGFLGIAMRYIAGRIYLRSAHRETMKKSDEPMSWGAVVDRHVPPT